MVRMWNRSATFENRIGFPQMVKQRINIWARKSNVNAYSRKMTAYTHIDAGTWKSTSTLFMITRRWMDK